MLGWRSTSRLVHHVGMSLSLRTPARRPRRHGEVLAPDARRSLERMGWRTTLEFREDHVRATNGQLIRVAEHWTAEAERYEPSITVATATADDPAQAWTALLHKVNAGDWQSSGRIRLRRAPAGAAGWG